MADAPVANLVGERYRSVSVIFDTNAIHTGNEYHLLNLNTKDVVQKHSRHERLHVRWLLPEVVILERRFQILSPWRKEVTSINKIEEFVGKSSNLTEAHLAQRVDDIIETEMKCLGIESMTVDYLKVDWQQLVARSIQRTPPFENIGPGKEKGFRDAIIWEAFRQLVDIGDPGGETLFLLVTNDNALGTAASEFLVDRANGRVITSVDELDDLLSRIASEVTDDWVNGIRDLASSYFFNEDNGKGLYFRGGVQDRIRADFGTKLSTPPTWAQSTRITQWLIGKPRFQGNPKPRVAWATDIKVKVEALAPGVVDGGWVPGLVPRGLHGPGQLGVTIPPWVTGQTGILSGMKITPDPRTVTGYRVVSTPGLVPKAVYSGREPSASVSAQSQQLVGTGIVPFQVLWSATLTKAGRWSHGRIDDIVPGEPVWEQLDD